MIGRHRPPLSWIGTTRRCRRSPDSQVGRSHSAFPGRWCPVAMLGFELPGHSGEDHVGLAPASRFCITVASVTADHEPVQRDVVDDAQQAAAREPTDHPGPSLPSTSTDRRVPGSPGARFRRSASVPSEDDLAGSIGAPGGGGRCKPLCFDVAGHRRSPVTMPGFHEGRAPRNKGRRDPADPPTVEEIIGVMREAGDSANGIRLRALIVISWRAGLRIGEALDLAETDLDPSRGAVLVRRGKGGRRREVEMDRWPGRNLSRGSPSGASCR